MQHNKSSFITTTLALSLLVVLGVAQRYFQNSVTAAKTKSFLESIVQADINGTEDKEIVLQAGPKEFKFSGRIFLTTFALPNLLFHVSTAYNILRHNGVDIGKMDYLGGA